MLKRLLHFAVGLDQALKALIMGGTEDVTISAELMRRELLGSLRAGFWRRRVDGLFLLLFGQERHCLKALSAEFKEFSPAHRIELTNLIRKKIKCR